MKKIVLLFITMLFAMVMNAADNAAEARKVLDKAAAKVNIQSGATASFRISGGKMGTHNGTISIKGNKFNARTDKAIIWYDGKTQWLYNQSNHEVNVSAPSASQQSMMNPYNFLTLYKKGYTMSMTSSTAGNQVHLVGKNKGISEMYVLVDKNSIIKQVKLKQKNQWITIDITNFKQAKLSDSAFRFNVKDYPKAEIIDLR